MLIGPKDGRWDLCFIAEYPSIADLLAMLRDPVYREAVKHRQAAVEDSRLIRLAPGAAGVGFGRAGAATPSAPFRPGKPGPSVGDAAIP